MRYVILEHDWPTLHWDLLLDAGPLLRAWRLFQEPCLKSPVAAEASFDHRRIYLDYEGPLTGNRGHVTRWDAGDYTVLVDLPERLAVVLTGTRLQGTLHLSMRRR